ncbi:excalibur calcium-binding domain-containing protein [Halobacillus hunanensis]|uniref:excalibur calcium-binding domain-containing protein n=1 Tax=Halobacillus hunanensis TaxID=578214 RepID=UPI0009A6408E|nr:excalibur calcium-binding domain-containing protein [Halobacillus hunanensis]
MKKLIVSLFALLMTIGGFSGVNVASAADKNCSDFDTKEEAQAFWDDNNYSVGNDPHDLDGNDNDGVPCESLPSDGSNANNEENNNTEDQQSTEETTPAADKDCKHFASQEEAQAYWDENGFTAGNDPQRLDRDGDSIPCEDGDESAANPSDEQSTSDSEETTAQQGGELPNTSTSYASYTLLGLILTVLGGSLFVIRKRFQ